MCALKYFLNADFSLKIISITPSAATAGATTGAAVVAADAAAFLSSLAAAAAVSVVVVAVAVAAAVVIRGPRSLRAASRLNATTLASSAAENRKQTNLVNYFPRRTQIIDAVSRQLHMAERQ